MCVAVLAVDPALDLQDWSDWVTNHPPTVYEPLMNNCRGFRDLSHPELRADRGQPAH